MWSFHGSLDLPGIALLRSRKSPTKPVDHVPATSGCSGSTLGVGHFTVPPDVIVEGPDCVAASNGDVTESWSTIRTIVVPHGIVAVPRRSPIKARKRTPWNPASEPQGVVERADSREWFTDRMLRRIKAGEPAGRLQHLGDGPCRRRDSRAVAAGREGRAD